MGGRFTADVELGVIGVRVETETVAVDDFTQWEHEDRGSLTGGPWFGSGPEPRPIIYCSTRKMTGFI